MNYRHIILLTAFAFTLNVTAQHRNSSESEKLGKALEYFSGGKYHEALILFTELDKKFNLNPRFKAYIGVCCYYEWDYENACKYFKKAIPEISFYSPQERSIYYYCYAESLFNLGKYKEAIPFYEQQLNVCSSNEKADALYRLGFCYMFNEDWLNARDYFQSSIIFYNKYPNPTPPLTARIRQIENMIKGCENKINDSQKQ